MSQSLRKLKKRRDKMRKPVEQRRSRPGNPTEEAIDGLVEFFTSLQGQFAGLSQYQPDVAQPGSEVPDSSIYGSHDDIQELEDMGALARDLIRRIQRLREQVRPRSSTPMALPDMNQMERTAEALAISDQELDERATNRRTESTSFSIQLNSDLPIEVDPDELEDRTDPLGESSM
jgi:hypothetical protein